MNQTTLNNLPDMCFSTLSSTGELIVINKGMSGYFPSSWSTPNREENEATAQRLNGELGVTEAQRKAMEFGSMFGWDKPGADPALYDKRPLQDKIADAVNRAAAQDKTEQGKTNPDLQH